MKILNSPGGGRGERKSQRRKTIFLIQEVASNEPNQSTESEHKVHMAGLVLAEPGYLWQLLHLFLSTQKAICSKIRGINGELIGLSL